MVVPRAARKRQTSMINFVLGPEGPKGTVADWMVVKEGVVSWTLALAVNTDALVAVKLLYANCISFSKSFCF